ncbi:MAG: hypothetical protein Q4D06_09765 [Coriobacteriia bacterium]|nr:hypothetical protein [Coriobacteriia bacterium]
MLDSRYLGTYAKATCPDRKMVGLLLGADTLVGDEFELFFKTDSGDPVAWIRTRFGQEIGYFDRNISYRLSAIKADGWTIRVDLAFIGMTDTADSGYWSMMGIVASPLRYSDEVGVFFDKVREQHMAGIRPDLELNTKAIDQMIEAKGNWVPTKNVYDKIPKKEGVIVKGERSLSEKLIEQGRAGNKGCYAISWAFIGLLVVGAVFLLKGLLGL